MEGGGRAVGSGLYMKVGGGGGEEKATILEVQTYLMFTFIFRVLKTMF